MLYLCTLFNKNYFSRGIAMYESLKKNVHDFHLYVFAFDNESYDALKKLNFPNITAISLREFEDEALKSVKPTRSAAEYCWTCTSSTILYSIKTFNLSHCTYLDADLYFYSDPSILINEAENNSVIITKHRYTPEYDQSVISGTYCVQFMYFRNDKEGLEVLNWWRDRCIEWCYAKVEAGKFGDQMYLEDWPTRFKNIHVSKHLGTGIAPWNVQQFTFSSENKATEKTTGNYFQPIFYHFHRVKFYSNNLVQYTDSEYKITADVNKFIYEPYITHLQKIKNDLEKSIHFDPHGTSIDQTIKPWNFKMMANEYLSNVKDAIKLILGRGLKHKKCHYHIHPIA